MPDKNEIYQIWAPPQALWSRWVKPVLFAFMDGVFELQSARNSRFETDWAPTAGSVALVIDLPGEDGVLLAMPLARLGYRPIPLYSALPFPLSEKKSVHTFRPASTVNVEPILAALYREATTLKQIPLLPDAPPAFLLDADRRLARIDPAPGCFDNRSVCFTTDFPSAEFLLTHGIHSTIIVQKNANPATDLTKTLLSWQQAGIQLFRKEPGVAGSPVPLIVRKPSFLRSFVNRISVAFGLRRGELGAFGRIVRSSSG